MDRLRLEDREALQAASVIGQRFALPVLVPNGPVPVFLSLPGILFRAVYPGGEKEAL